MVCGLTLIRVTPCFFKTLKDDIKAYPGHEVGCRRSDTRSQFHPAVRTLVACIQRAGRQTLVGLLPQPIPGHAGLHPSGPGARQP